jgi:Spy/CpxP family protein refolding chaperone
MTPIAEKDDFDRDDFTSRAATATLDAPARPHRGRAWTSAALGLVIFLSGLVCGAAGMRMAGDQRRQVNWSDLLERVARRMQRDLDLTEDQQASIAQVVQSHQPELTRIRARTVKEMRTELQQVIEDMSVVLTAEQASQFRAEAQPRLDLYFPADGENAGRQANVN